MKGIIRRFFCWHDFQQITDWERGGRYEYGARERGKLPRELWDSALFQCKKCGKFKRITIKL